MIQDPVGPRWAVGVLPRKHKMMKDVAYGSNVRLGDYGICTAREMLVSGP
jgi:hypothetical protein